ncbi:unnamed protein product, partial [Mesorhabditis belari]|uniref:Major facilitator superfamily (MFS) profile domain-containing protein n=1 Tax=Mesorhabditis belari TaxID=2138241 RepID=A0AAF3ESU5_9BILA
MPDNEPKDERERRASKVDETETKLEAAGIVKPPDGGYGWVVVAASFIANMIVDGIIFTVGESCLKLWKADFASSDTAAAFTTSLLSGSYLLVGPLASALANNYGCRAVTILGAFISFFGFMASTLVPQIFLLYITFGVIGGVGFGLVYLPAIVIVPQYFDNKRALAVGLAVCGSGIGTSLFALLNPIVMTLVNNQWRYFIVFIAFSSLISVLAGLFFKPVQATEKQVEEVTKLAEEYEKEKEPAEGLRGERNNFDPNRPFLSTLELNAEKTQQKDVWSQHDLATEVARESVTDLNRPLSKQDVFYPGSTSSLHQRTRTRSDASSHKSNPSAADREAFIKPDEVHQSSHHISTVGLPAAAEPLPPSGPRRWLCAVGRAFGGLVDRQLLKLPTFVILAISGFLTLTCFYVPFAYLGRHLEKIEGLTDFWKSFPLQLLGVINIVFRILCGKISDSPKVDSLWVSNAGLILAGLATMAVPLFTQYWHFIAFCFPFAFGVACFAALRSVICVDLWGLEKLSSAFGTLLLFMGVGALVGSPIAASIKDWSGNFDISFYVMGVLMTLSGLICIPLRKLRAWELQKYGEETAKTVELQPLKSSA